MRITYETVLNNSLVKNFINEKPKREQMIYAYFFSEDSSNNKILNEEFTRFFYEIRLIKYVVTLYENFSMNYRVTLNKKNNREPLILNKPLDENNFTLLDKISNASLERDFEIDQPEKGLEGVIKCEQFLNQLKSLNELQIKIIWKNIVEERNLKEIADDLGVTIQNISQVKKRAIKKIRGEKNEST